MERQRYSAWGGATQYEFRQQPTSVQSKPAPPVSPSARQAGLQNVLVLPGSYGLAHVPEQQAVEVLHNRLSCTQAWGARHTPWVQVKPVQQLWVALQAWPSSRQTATTVQLPPTHGKALQQFAEVVQF